MAIIQRPTKQGNATTYQGKVAAGYTTILASEMDADLDLIYSAWNQGVDGSNIQPGVITGNMLAPGAVGSRELQDGGVQTVDIGDGQVTNAKISDVAWSKLTGGSAAAGGDLAGTYPSPSLGIVQSGNVVMNPRAHLDASVNSLDLIANTSVDPAYDSTKPSYLINLNYAADEVGIFRSPVGGGAWVQLFLVNGSDGKTYCTLADGSVNRTQIAVNAPWGPSAFAPTVPGFLLTTGNVWTTVASLPSITTRGGVVHLWAAAGLSANAPAGGSRAWVRWTCDGAEVLKVAHQLNPPSGTIVPLPDLVWAHNPGAGAHVYAYQAFVEPSGCTIFGSGAASGGGFVVQEIG